MKTFDKIMLIILINVTLLSFTYGLVIYSISKPILDKIALDVFGLFLFGVSVFLTIVIYKEKQIN